MVRCKFNHTQDGGEKSWEGFKEKKKKKKRFWMIKAAEAAEPAKAIPGQTIAGKN